MKKLLLCAVVVVSASVSGQRAQKGDLQLNAGLAFPHRYADNVGLYAGLDYGIHNDITLGVEARFGAKDYGYGVDGRWFGLGFNGNYHFNRIMQIPNNFDFYAGATIGFNTFTWTNPQFYEYVDAQGNMVRKKHESEAGLSAQVGGRYFFTNNFGLNAEANVGNVFNGGKFGITYKF